MWFANNTPVEKAVLGYAAKYAIRHGVKLFALAIEGSHIQLPALFPNSNRADFMRDFNSNVAKAVIRLTENYPGGGLFGRRYSNEFTPGNDDIEEYFFYTALQPVHDGLVERISDFPFYNCFSDAVNGIERKVEVPRWEEYRAKKRHDPLVSIKDFTDIFILKYERLPGYEHLTQKEYSNLMHQKLEVRRAAIVKERLAAGVGVVGRNNLLKTIPGTPAKNPKRSNRNSHRPRILCVCPERREKYKTWYFNLYFAFKKASELYRKGDLSVIFPIGMYPPHLPCQKAP